MRTTGDSMEILLDTCALIWLAMGGGKLSEMAKESIEKAKTVYVSSISAFEIAHAASKRSIELPCDPQTWFYEVMESHDLSEIYLTGAIAAMSVKLPPIHKDPCDRFIIATAQTKNLTIATGDQIIEKYDVTTIS